MVIFYDSFCPICNMNARIWKNLDCRNQLHFYSFRDLPDYPHAMEKLLHVRDSGHWYTGYEAIIQICKKLPVLWIVLPVLYAIKLLGLGDTLYSFIANNRKLIPVNQCHNGVCDISH